MSLPLLMMVLSQETINCRRKGSDHRTSFVPGFCNARTNQGALLVDAPKMRHTQK